MKKADIVFASTNAGKISEMKYLVNKNLGKYDFELNLLSLQDIGFTEEIIEDGETFEENAKIKAQAVFDKTGMICFADDSGLCVDYLNGAPGIHTARYQGMDWLLNEMKDVPDEKRAAQFYCAIYCVVSQRESFCVLGKSEGFITREKIGESGFGHDPVFYSPLEGKTFAQMTSEEKNKISHRAFAAELFSEKIVKYI